MSGNRVVVQEGYELPFADFGAHRRRRRTSRRGGSHRSKFKAAAKACKGKSLHAFRACMKKKLRK